MSRSRLKSLADVTGAASLPDYTPENHSVGMVHIGVGAFHRAHQAAMTDDALAQYGGDWRILGVSLRSIDIAQNLNQQNGLYTLIERDGSNTGARVIASIDRVIAADPKATLNALCDPDIRIVTITVTESGYGIDRKSRLPDTSDKNVAADLLEPEDPLGLLGLLVASIARRRKAGHIPFTVLSCDNLPENGNLLRDGVIGFARQTRGDLLAHWIAANITFPCCMVDRITPAPTAETELEAANQTGCDDKACVETEPFTQWIIEDNFPSGRPQWEAGGALFVADVTPYERMKLTMLNGSHSMLAYTGFLNGKRYVRDVMADAELAGLVQRHLRVASEVLPPLPSIDFSDYAQDLTNRFSNPSIAHETYQIATDGTQKLPQRIFQPAVESLDEQRSVRPFAFATAMWMRYCLQRLDDGTHYELRDPRSSEIGAAVAACAENSVDLSVAFHDLPDLIPARLAADEAWHQAIDEILNRTLEEGCLAAVHFEATLLGHNYSE